MQTPSAAELFQRGRFEPSSDQPESADPRGIHGSSFGPVLDLSAMAVVTRSVADICRAAKAAARQLAQVDSATKDRALLAIADALEARLGEILEANARDLEAGRDAGLSSALMDRLALDERRVAAMATGVREIVALPDPVGEVLDGFRLP